MTETPIATAITPEIKEEKVVEETKREKLIGGEWLCHTKDKTRIFIVASIMYKGPKIDEFYSNPHYYLLMEMSNHDLNWVSDVDIQRWFRNETIVHWKPLNYQGKIDEYWFKLRDKD